MIRSIFIVFLITGFSLYPVNANPFKELNLDPSLFQLQSLKLSADQSTGILSEYILREIQNYPGAHGLTLSNLIAYQDVLAQKSNTVTTESLEYLAFDDELQKRFNLDDILVLRGYFLGSRIQQYEQNPKLVQEFLNQALKSDRSSWVQFIAVLVSYEAQRIGLDLGKNQPNLDNVLQRINAGKDADAYFHFVLGHYYLKKLKNAETSPYRRLRLVVSAFESARTRDPRNRSLFTSITSSYISMHEELQQAGVAQPFEFEELVFRRIILLDPRNPWAHNNLAYLYCQHNVELLEALREARIANHLEKNNPYLMDTLGWALYKNKMYKDAEEILKKAIAINPELPDIHFHLATVHYDMKQFEQAVKSFKRTAELDPSSSLALNNLAYLYSEMGINLEEALSLVERAIGMQPENSAYLDTIGWIHFKLGNYQDAVSFLKKAADLDPDSAETQYHLSQAYLKLGGTDESVKHLRNSMKLDGDSTTDKSNQTNLSQMILMNSIREARDKYLAMSNVPKDRKSLKVFYDQLIFLAQSIGDFTLVQKYAQELQNFPQDDPALDAQEILHDHEHHFDDAHDHSQDALDEESSIGSTISPTNPSAALPKNLTIRSFFPKQPDLYLELSRESLSFIISKLLQSSFFSSRGGSNLNLQDAPVEALIVQNMPEKMAVYIGNSDPKLKTQIYSVVKLNEYREQVVWDTLKNLVSSNFQVPWFNEQFELRESDGVFHLKGQQFNFFIALRKGYLMVSNSLIAIRKTPYSTGESLESNMDLSTPLSSEANQSAILFCGNLSIFNEINDQNLKQFLMNDADEFKNWLNKVSRYISIVTLKESSLEELEIVSFKNAQDIPQFQELLKRKSEELKKDYLKNSGVDLDSQMQINKDQLEIKTRVNDLNKFLNHFLNFLRDEGEKLLDNQNKNGEEQ